MAGGSTQFRTFQNMQAYEDALARHAQYIRWMKGYRCPCLNANTGQADPTCLACNGRGIAYKTPGPMSVLQEIVKHGNTGQMYPMNIPVVLGTPIVTRKGEVLALAASQPSDGSYVQLDPPYPKAWEQLYIDYDFTLVISVTDEDSTVIGTDTLKTIASLFTARGKTFEGSIKEVSEVYNVTREETYTVVDAIKEYIYLQNMGTWQSGDVLQVDYEYVKPSAFLLLGISEKMRYTQAYVAEEAEALLVVPYYAKISSTDLFTALSSEQEASVVIDPTVGSGVDEINGYFDVSELGYIIDKNGVEYTIGTDLELYGRNGIKWNVTKPTVPYSIVFLYHPTFSALIDLPSLRNAENKSFVNKINLKLFDRTSGEFTV